MLSFWSRLAHWILRHRRPILLAIGAITLILGYFATQIKSDHTAGQFVSTDSKVYQDFERAKKIFGESQTVLYLVFRDVDPYAPSFLQALDSLNQDIAAQEGVERVLSLANVPYLVRDSTGMTARPLYVHDLPARTLRQRIQGQPFLHGLLLADDSTTTAMLVKIESAFNNTPERIALVNHIEAAAQHLPGEVALAGFPYLRTAYAQRITREAPLFTLLALLISLVVLYLTFGSWRAVTLPTLIVGLGILWTLGLMALFDQRLNIVSSVLPALLVIIGMANVIHLCTKFIDQYQTLGDAETALVEMIRTVGLATFLTCLTTAIGFGVLTLSGSALLSRFGLMAAVGIMLLYVLSITLTPIAFVAYRPSTRSQTPLATHGGMAWFFGKLAGFTKRHSIGVLVGSGVLVLLGIVGITRISSDLYVFSDFYEDDPLRQDLAVFEQAFGGVLPMEVVIESKKAGQFRALPNLRRVEKLERTLQDLEPVGTSLAISDLVKLANQAYFGGNPATYRLPSSYELPFLQTSLQGFLDQKGKSSFVSNLPIFVDSTFSVTRVYLGVTDIGTTRMNALADTVLAETRRIFPTTDFDSYVTGTAIRATRSGENLVTNLIVSLAVALVVISVLMALLFRSARLMLISIVPNLIPLVVVGGAMGFTGVILKPSTALIFSIAFGIAVDSTIHFLAKYRLHRNAGEPLEASVAATLRETGKAILFTSVVLMGGFLAFTLSSFGGTVNMGALTALTLGMAMVANLLLLPALLYRFGPR